MKTLIRNLLIVALVACVSHTLLAVEPMLHQGTRTLSLSGQLDDDGDDFGAFLAVRAGYFVMDYMEAGIRASGQFRGSDFKTISIGGYGIYNVDIGQMLVPYVGGSASFVWWDTQWDDDTYLEFSGFGGARYFFVDYAAVGAELAILFATEDIYNRGEDSMDWVIRLNTTWHF